MNLHTKEIDYNETAPNLAGSYTFTGLLNTIINNSCENKEATANGKRVFSKIKLH